MALAKYILALDQGTTSSRSFLYDSDFNLSAFDQKEFKQIFPRSGWVEHDPETIWKTQITTAKKAISKGAVSVRNIAGIGITNQRETTVVWNKETGEPLYNAIVWQDRRTSDFCSSFSEASINQVAEKTGLCMTSLFSRCS